MTRSGLARRKRGLHDHVGHCVGGLFAGTGPPHQLAPLVGHQFGDLVEGHLVQRPLAQIAHRHRGRCRSSAAPAGARLPLSNSSISTWPRSVSRPRACSIGARARWVTFEDPAPRM